MTKQAKQCFPFWPALTYRTQPSIARPLSLPFDLACLAAGDELPVNPSSARWIPGSYCRILIARAITSAPRPRDATASTIISSLAHRLIAEMSVGLNAVAVQKASDR